MSMRISKSALLVGVVLLMQFAVVGTGWAIETSEDALFGGGGSAEDDLFGGSTEDSLFGDSGSQEDDLFGGGLVSEVTEDAASTELEDTLLTTSGVELGGRFAFSLGSTWNWSDLEGLRNNFSKPDSESLDTKLQATLHFDARPDKDFRVFGKAKVAYPFTEDENRSFDDIVQVTELFSDFNHDEKLFFRAGKQTINWGVGYFFSPADIINLTPIDPEDPEAEREGPLSLKVNMPVDVHNLYLYAIDNQAKSIKDLAWAGKAEVVLHSSELGLGGYYQRDTVPMAMATISSSLGNLAVFGEGVMKYGSDKRFVREVDLTENPLGVEAYTVKDKPFWAGTAGFRYGYLDDQELFNVNLAGQYFYNGEGYAEADPFPAGTVTLLAQKKLAFSDLMSSGKHYGAANLGWLNMLRSDLSANLTWIGNLTDESGRLSSSLSWSPWDRISTSVGISYNYGEQGREFSRMGNPVSLFFRTSLGGGQF